MCGEDLGDKWGCVPASVGVSGGQPGGRAVESGLCYGKLSFLPFRRPRVLPGRCVSSGMLVL